MKPYRAAVIGCGLIGSRFARDAGRIGVFTHAGAYAACERTELAALCDADAALLAEAGRQWKVDALYRDLAGLLAESRPDIVSICTPDDTHATLLKQVLAAPGVKAVFAEKPLATSLPDAREIVALARGRVVLLNYSRHFATNHVGLKSLLGSGGIGRIVAVQGVYTKGLRHNGSHWIDLARWLVGEIATVQAFDSLREGGADPTLDLRLHFQSGATGSLTGLSAGNYSIFEMDILGTEGRVRLSDGGWVVEHSPVECSPHYTGYRTPAPSKIIPGDMRDVTLRGVNHLTECLDQPGTPLACTVQDGLLTLLVAEAAGRSLVTARMEPVPEK
jgi:predicted dehydrogenase